ncbi:MAG: carboxypeptidase regulatory-like domain-containing protein [Terriglobales bacterium]
MPTSKWFRMSCWLISLSLALSLCLICSTMMFAQGTGGRILGRVADPSGAVLAGVKVTLTNEATGVSNESTTNGAGDYGFPQVPVGTYTLSFDLAGFKTNVRKGIVVDLNQVITLNSSLQIGETKETVEVTSEAPLVDTSSTQLGAVMDARQVANLPLNTRDTYQLLQLQPGVMSTVGSSNTLVYGSDNSGAVSVNGGRGRANNFSVNGGDANDLFVNLPTVQPSPDSIQEFRVLTNTFDAEYGRNSGSVVNVVTKSGTNDWHGSTYEFFRNKVLNADEYCLTAADGLPCGKPQFNQNQFGGTFGGPIKKERTFFFASYEGRRIRQGIPSPAVTVPSAQERPSSANLVNGQIVANFTDVNPGAPTPFTGNLANSSMLLNRAGCQTATTAIGGGTISDNAPYASIFPTGQIPLACMDATAVDLLQFVPNAAGTSNLISTVPTRAVRGDQFTVKIDHRINDKQNLSIYYYFNDDRTLNPFADFELTGADVPGFGSIVAERFQQWNFTHTWTINNSTVNEARFNYNREGQQTFQHPANTELVQNSCPPAPSWLTGVLGTPPCFYGDGSTDPNGSLYGIHPFLGAVREGLPSISVSGGFDLGNNSEGELPQTGNSFQWADSLTKVKGNHTLKFGVDVRRQQFNQFYYYNVNGTFSFYGEGSNDPGACIGGGTLSQQCSENLYPNFLLGLPDEYGQGSAQVEYVRNTGLYLFAQDSWKIKPNLTLNYGLRWELNTPLADVAQHVETFRPGQSSTVYPCGGPNTDCSSQDAVGLVVPGDPGVPPGMTQTYYKAFAPRIGIAWSPGSSGKTSFRAGWGLFYNPVEQLVLAQFGAEPPFGGSTTVNETQFDLPFLGQDGVTNYLNPFNGVLSPKRGTPQDWAVFEPIDLFGDFQPHMRTQYSAQYNFTIQHEVTRDTKLEIGYVGSQGHRLLATHDINYSDPQTCLDINTVLGAGTCGPFLEDSQFIFPAGAVAPAGGFHLPYGPNGPTVIPAGTSLAGLDLVGLRRYSSPQCNPFTGAGCPADGVPVFTSILAQDTVATSSYNSLQVSVERRFAHGLQFSGAYTWSKSLDEASSFEGILNPLPGAHNRALSLFDARHRFVISYYWEVPARKYSGFTGKLLDNWGVSGITTYQTGFPIRITSSSDLELMNSASFEFPGEPNQIAPFTWQRPQSNGNYYFNNSTIFSNNGINGTVGNAPRTICCGPGISETDFSAIKNIAVNERTHFEFRAELFNVFNHTQFYNPDGNITDGSQFGQVTQVKDPRLAQFALKLYF